MGRGSTPPQPQPVSREGKRRRLKSYLFRRYGCQEPDGTWRASCAFGCGEVLTWDTASIDRYPIPGRDGGEYTRKNTRLACRPCNCADRCLSTDAKESPPARKLRGNRAVRGLVVLLLDSFLGLGGLE